MDNDERAAVAFGAVKEFRDLCGGSPLHVTEGENKGKFCKDGMAEAIGDLIGNLCHLASDAGLDPFTLIEHGLSHYAVECIDDDGMFAQCDATVTVRIRRYGKGKWQPFNDETVARLRKMAEAEIADD